MNIEIEEQYFKKISKLITITTACVSFFSSVGFIMSTIKKATPVSITAVALIILALMIILDMVVAKTSPEKYALLSGIFFFVFYTYCLFFATGDHIYVIMFPIAITYILFNDRKLSGIIALMFGSVNVVNILYYALVTHKMRSGEPINIVTFFLQATSAIITMLIVYLATNVLLEHNKIQISEVNEAKNLSDSMLKDVLNVVNVVRKNTEEAGRNIADLGSDVETTKQSIDDISFGNDDNAKSIEAQTLMTGNIQEMLKVAKDMSERVKESSTESLHAVSEGRRVIGELLEHSISTEETNSNVVTAVERLIENARGITASVAEISNISSKTNLLALNASIESARAGEAGRGFAVVAAEIGSLASNTKQLTDKIQTLIEDLTADADSAKDTVAHVIEVTAAEKELINNTNEKFDTIGSNIDNLSSDVNEICDKIDEVYESNNRIVDSISNISAVSEEVASKSAEAVEISERCAEKADNVMALMRELESCMETLKQYK